MENKNNSKYYTRFIEKSNIVHSNKYDYSSVEYTTTNQKVDINCPMHGLFQITPTYHLQGHGCKKCNQLIKPIRSTKSTSQFVIEANKIHQNKFTYTKTQYSRALTKVIITCPIHGDFEQRPNDHLSGYGCNKCRPNISMGTDEFIKRSQHLNGTKRYDYSETVYLNRISKVTINCKRHGLFQQKPEAHLKGSGCPKCQFSKGESFINACLERLKIQFEIQKSFIDCVSDNNRVMRFDFYVPSYNLLIEFDGKQHYEPAIGIFTPNHTPIIANDLLIKRQRFDDIKTQYAKSNNIKLLRIPYWDFKNIERIIANALNSIIDY